MTKPDISRAEPRRAPSARPEPELRWRILDDLTRARDAFDLKDRTLQVLRALLSFLPRGESRRFIVFPSNRILSERLLGMPESTLRRHLGRLCEAGLIARHDSPNRKRYRIGAVMQLTFGLDLTPLFAAAAHIRDTAREALQRRQRIAELRACIRSRLHDLDEETRAEINRALRRRLSEEALTDLLDSLPQAAQDPGLPPETPVADSRNERHIQTSSESESSPDPESIARSAIEEVARITDHPLRDARDIEKSGRSAALAMGVSDAWAVAQHRRGAIWATMALAYLHRRLRTLQRPGPYLLSLVERSGKDQFDVIAALAVRAEEKLTAVNSGVSGCKPCPVGV